MGVEEMMARRLLALAVLLVPLVIGFRGYTMFHGRSAILAFEAPEYPDIATEQMVAELSKEQIATLAKSAMDKSKQMEGLWQSARQADYEMFLTSLAVTSLLAIALFVFLWRSTPNKALQGDVPRPAGSGRA